MSCNTTNWLTLEEFSAGLRQHFDRMNADPEYRKMVEGRTAAYRERIAQLDACVAAGISGSFLNQKEKPE
jgi:hypothetical protein